MSAPWFQSDLSSQYGSKVVLSWSARFRLKAVECQKIADNSQLPQSRLIFTKLALSYAQLAAHEESLEECVGPACTSSEHQNATRPTAQRRKASAEARESFIETPRPASPKRVVPSPVLGATRDAPRQRLGDRARWAPRVRLSPMKLGRVLIAHRLVKRELRLGDQGR